jgi:hypothetical protein
MMNEKTYTFSDELISDLHKDAMGFRPGEAFWGFWATASDDEKQAEWDSLCKWLEQENVRFAEVMEHATKEFEKHVTAVIESGAKTRETALQWIMDGSGADGDWDYLCYLKGLPYGYLKRPIKEVR